VWIALLQDIRDATRAPCPITIVADRCYLATVDAASAAYGRAPAAQLGWSFVLGGEPTPTMTIGVTAGRIVGLVRGAFPIVYGGKTYENTQLIARLTYPATTVRRPTRPPAATTVAIGSIFTD
jgi:hypothetical protein